jgi:hypothetical protein
MIIARLPFQQQQLIVIPTTTTTNDNKILLTTIFDILQLDVNFWTISKPWNRNDEETLYVTDGDLINIVPKNGMGLLGGKGGFGAGLRAMGKGVSQAKPVEDFSLCRDLQGRRLGAMNEAARAELLRQNPNTQVDNWVLQRPSWAEPVSKKTRLLNNNNTNTKTNNEDGRNVFKPTQTSYNNNDVFALDFARKIDATERSVVSAVMAGLQKSRNNNNISNDDGDNTLDETTKPTTTTTADVNDTIEIYTGEADVLQSNNTFIISGQSDFATILFHDAVMVCNDNNNNNTVSSIILEAKCITEGLVQVGFITQTILQAESPLISETSQDGVGDVLNSWAIDGARSLLWLEGIPSWFDSVGDITATTTTTTTTTTASSAGTTPTIIPWSNGDIISCEIDNEGGIQFSFNHKMVSKRIATTATTIPHILIGAISLELDQVVEITIIKKFKEIPTTTTTNSSSATTSSSTTTIPLITIEQLKELGSERLKQELSDLGLKKGGTMEERAARLFLAKTLPREDWPAHLFPS